MKKIIAAILLMVMICALAGCSATNKYTFPRVRIEQSIYYSDDIYIPLRTNHTFIINHLYDEVETENGYDIIIHIKTAPSA